MAKNKRKIVAELKEIVNSASPYPVMTWYNVGDEYPAGLYIAYENGGNEDRKLVQHTIVDHGHKRIRHLSEFGPELDQRIYTRVYGPLPHGATK